MRMPDRSTTVSAVQVDVFDAVGIDDRRTFAAADPERLRTRDLPTRGHPAGQRGAGARRQVARAGLALHDERLLLGDQLVKTLVNPGGGCSRGVHRRLSASCMSDQTRDTAFRKLPGDDDSLDLGGPFPDALDTQLAIEALGDVLAHVAAATEDLQATVGEAP